MGHDWTNNMITIWKNDVAQILGQCINSAIPLHTSYIYAVAIPGPKSFSYTCRFIDSEALNTLSLSICNNPYSNLTKIFEMCSFQNPKMPDLPQEPGSATCGTNTQDSIQLQPTQSQTFINVLSNSLAPETDSMTTKSCLLNRTFSNLQSDRSQTSKIVSKLKLIVDKILEKKYNIVCGHELYEPCSKKLFVISKMYLKDIKDTKNYVELIIKVVKDNAKQVVEFETQRLNL
ncbi:Mdm2-binding protein [Thelohanellus kitauei]|uniref:Mdm2-binding protein n=1 Tax=Thelohanellus kitauei TaxID=669202 RepID=A0A0C2N2R4_THEKT|nr:Mdm2-binding protein [Thelohanellus kitauei]